MSDYVMHVTRLAAIEAAKHEGGAAALEAMARAELAELEEDQGVEAESIFFHRIEWQGLDLILMPWSNAAGELRMVIDIVEAKASKLDRGPLAGREISIPMPMTDDDDLVEELG